MKGEQPFPLILLSCVCHKKFPPPLNSAYCHQHGKNKISHQTLESLNQLFPYNLKNN